MKGGRHGQQKWTCTSLPTNDRQPLVCCHFSHLCDIQFPSPPCSRFSQPNVSRDDSVSASALRFHNSQFPSLPVVRNRYRSLPKLQFYFGVRQMQFPGCKFFGVPTGYKAELMMFCGNGNSHRGPHMNSQSTPTRLALVFLLWGLLSEKGEG